LCRRAESASAAMAGLGQARQRNCTSERLVIVLGVVGWYMYTKDHQSSNQYPKVNKRHHIQLHHHFEKINSNQTKPNHPQQCPPPTGNSTSSTNSSPVPQDLPVLQHQHHETHRPLAGVQHPDRALTHKYHEVPALSVQQEAHMDSPSSPQRHHQQQQLVENHMTDILNFANSLDGSEWLGARFLSCAFRRDGALVFWVGARRQCVEWQWSVFKTIQAVE
jgi:hypothetical protein